jgi:ABC-type Fe3+ transport system permease subunit
MLKEILSVLVLLSSIPAGFILAWLTSDELKQGKKYFRAIILLSLILGLIFFGLDYYAVSLTFLYMLIVTGICWKKA